MFGQLGRIGRGFGRLGYVAPCWRMSGASLDLDFTRNLGYALGSPYATSAALLTTTRASDAYADDTAGNWSLFTSGLPRITDKGLLVEEARTNSIRNNSMQGAVAGTPGTLPTNWINAYGTLSRTVVGTGTQNGVDYIDIRYNGTTSTTFFNILFDAITAQAAVNGQSWAESVFLAIVGGSFTNITDIAVRGSVFDSGSGYLGEAWTPTNFTSLPSSLDAASRKREAGTLAFASAAYINPYLQFRFASGVAIDITLRIGWPQLELGAFATSPIRTTSAAATRAADAISVTSPPAFGTAVTAFVNAIVPTPTNTATKYLTGQALNNRIAYFSSNDAQVSMYNGTTILSMNGTGGWSLGAKAAAAIDASGRAIVMNGGTVATDANAQTIPTSIGIGSVASSVGGVAYIRRIAYFPTRLTNAQLQAITAP